ncbi:MAG: hypothetical protein GTO02_19235 [Candidatus Dadabacteria bacterium]|nr:hypothetical protein [Candidatus Dadabacteria bacterium]
MFSNSDIKGILDKAKETHNKDILKFCKAYIYSLYASVADEDDFHFWENLEVGERLSSNDLAELIVDGLYPKCVSGENFNLAVEIAEEEIEARKAIGDY